MDRINDLIKQYIPIKSVYPYTLELTNDYNKESFQELLNLYKSCFKYRILTNGVLIGKEPKILDALKRNGITELSVGNIEGVDYKTQELLTGDGKTLEYTIQGIKNAIKKGFNVGVYNVVNTINKDQMDAICQNMYQIGVTSIRFYRLLPIGNAKTCSELVLNPGNAEQVIKNVFALRKKFDKRFRISLANNFGPDLFSKKTLEYLADPTSESRYVCYAASPEYIAVEPLTKQTKYYPCFMGMGEKNLESNSPYKNFDVEKLKGMCGLCDYKQICGGGCRMTAYALTGDFYGSMDICQTKVKEKMRGGGDKND